MRPQPSWLDCASPGCPRGTYADPHQLTHICAAGGWYCGTHDTEDDITTDKENHR